VDGSDSDPVGIVLAKVDELFTTHRLAEAEPLLKALLDDPDTLTAAPRPSAAAESSSNGVGSRAPPSGTSRPGRRSPTQSQSPPPYDRETYCARHSARPASSPDIRASSPQRTPCLNCLRSSPDTTGTTWKWARRSSCAPPSATTGQPSGARETSSRRLPQPPTGCLLTNGATSYAPTVLREQAVSARVARDLDRARRLLIGARDIYRRRGRRVGVANAERELGATVEQLGDTDGARRHYVTAFTAYLRAGRRLGAAHAARRIGNLDLVAGLRDPAALPRARRRFQQALRVGAGEPTNAALTTLFLGRLARLEGDLDTAEQRLDEATERYAQLGTAPEIARDLSQIALELGLVARARGDRAAAVALFREALAALQDTDDPGSAALAHFHLAFDLIQAADAEHDVAARAQMVVNALRHAVTSFSLNDESGRRLQEPDERRSFYVEHRDTYALALHCAARAGDGRTALTVALAARRRRWPHSCGPAPHSHPICTTWYGKSRSPPLKAQPGRTKRRPAGSANCMPTWNAARPGRCARRSAGRHPT
jgi:tetratricopeptide (TPR) repeat protein